MTRPSGWPPRENGMPSLSHLDSANALNALLNMLLSGVTPLSPAAQALVTNLTRLSDKAVTEYENARAALDRYLDPDHPLSEMFRTFDHQETCLDAVDRAGRHAEALRRFPGPPRITMSQLPTPQARKRVRHIRNAIQHAEERVLDGKTGAGTGRPAGLIATSRSLVAGQRGIYIRYDWLASWITIYHDLVRDLIDR